MIAISYYANKNYLLVSWVSLKDTNGSQEQNMEGGGTLVPGTLLVEHNLLRFNCGPAWAHSSSRFSAGLFPSSSKDGSCASDCLGLELTIQGSFWRAQISLERQAAVGGKA